MPAGRARSDVLGDDSLGHGFCVLGRAAWGLSGVRGWGCWSDAVTRLRNHGGRIAVRVEINVDARGGGRRFRRRIAPAAAGAGQQRDDLAHLADPEHPGGDQEQGDGRQSGH